MGGVDSMANSLSEKGPVDEGSPSDERGGAWCDARSTTLNVELIPTNEECRRHRRSRLSGKGRETGRRYESVTS